MFSLLVKLVWQLVDQKDKPWVHLMISKYCKDGNFRLKLCRLWGMECSTIIRNIFSLWFLDFGQSQFLITCVKGISVCIFLAKLGASWQERFLRVPTSKFCRSCSYEVVVFVVFLFFFSVGGFNTLTNSS